MNQSTDTSAQAQPLPAPGYEMDDGQAAEWLTDLANFYSPCDALLVRGFAFRLRQQHNDGMAAARELADQRAEEIRSLESEVDGLEDDLMDAKHELSTAQDRIKELKG